MKQLFILLTALALTGCGGTIADEDIKAFDERLTPELSDEDRARKQANFCYKREKVGLGVSLFGTIFDILTPAFVGSTLPAVIGHGAEAGLKNETTAEINRLCADFKAGLSDTLTETE